MIATLTEMHDVVARKEHRCSWCNKRIFKFEVHKSGVFKMDGVYTWRECSRCEEMVSEFFASSDYLDGEHTGEAFAEWLLENHPVTYWKWALEDAKVERSLVLGKEREMNEAEFMHLRYAADYHVLAYRNRLDIAERADRIDKLERTCCHFYRLIEQANDEEGVSTDDANNAWALMECLNLVDRYRAPFELCGEVGQ